MSNPNDSKKARKDERKHFALNQEGIILVEEIRKGMLRESTGPLTELELTDIKIILYSLRQTAAKLRESGSNKHQGHVSEEGIGGKNKEAERGKSLKSNFKSIDEIETRFRKAERELK